MEAVNTIGQTPALGKQQYSRAIVHYLFSFFILIIYGGQVCPYIDSLDITSWSSLLAFIFVVAFVVRSLLLPRMVENAPHISQVKRQFLLEILLYISLALIVTFYNFFQYDFPIGSGLKVLVAMLTLGVFTAADLGLERERSLSLEFVNSGKMIIPHERYFPLTKKFTLLAVTIIITAVGIVFLVISKDLIWLASIEQNNLSDARMAVMGELLFVGAAFLGEIINLIVSFSRNLNLFFNNENTTLASVSSGNLQVQVPVSSNDEFGVMAYHTNQMIDQLRERTRELLLTQDATILSLASLAETRDNETGMHILRTQRYVKALCEVLKDKPRFRDFLDAETIQLLYKSAPLHDIGKVGVSDAILKKPGKLTEEEFEIMKKHTLYGKEALDQAGEILGSTSFLKLAGEIAYSHHEKWDGSGYPEGLAGDAIPVSGRLMALADVYDALISKRVYKEAFSHEKTRDIIIKGKGKHFDPDLVDAFVVAEENFKEIARQYADENTEQ